MRKWHESEQVMTLLSPRVAVGINRAEIAHRGAVARWERRARRRDRFIREQRLSPAEAAFLPANFNPGPEYDSP